MLEYIIKIVKSIDLSKSIEQVEGAKKMIENFIKTYDPRQELKDDLNKYYEVKYKSFEEEIV